MEQNLELTPAQRKIHFVTRRGIAVKSFWLLLIVGASLLAAGLTSDEVSSRIEQMGFLIGTLLGCWAAIIMAYFGASSFVDNGKLRK